MGAQTEKRKQMFIKRYEEVDNSEGICSASLFVLNYDIQITFYLTRLMK